jgi:hypothetical protein
MALPAWRAHPQVRWRPAFRTVLPLPPDHRPLEEGTIMTTLPPHAWPKNQKSPEKGTPFRHARDRAQLLLDTASEAQLRKALALLVATRPELALTVLSEACDPDQEPS